MEGIGGHLLINVDRVSFIVKRLKTWFNEYMPLMLLGIGSILFAAAFNLWVTNTGENMLAWVLFILALFFWSAAILLQWKREKAEEKSNKDREQREIERHDQYMSQFGEGGHSPKGKNDKST